MNRSRVAHKNIYKSTCWVTNCLHLDAIKQFVIEVVLFILARWLDSYVASINCSNSLLERRMSCQLRKSKANGKKLVWTRIANDPAYCHCILYFMCDFMHNSAHGWFRDRKGPRCDSVRQCMCKPVNKNKYFQAFSPSVVMRVHVQKNLNKTADWFSV